MYCTKCGTQLNDGANFCTKCGARTDVTDTYINGQAQQPKSKSRAPAILWIPVVLFLLIVCIDSFLSPSTDAEDSQSVTESDALSTQETESLTQEIEPGTDQAPLHSFVAEAWYAEHCAGETQKKYIDQWVKVSGTVLTISEYGNLKGYYLVGGQGAGIVCWVYSSELDAQYGQYIEYVGKVAVEDSKHIEISDGRIESAEWPSEKPKSPITISEWSWNRDYVGGVEWNFKFTNNTEKTIKYIIMEWDCYNAVGDLVYDEITGASNYSVKYTGPLEALQTTDLLCNTSLFYSHSYSSAKLTKLQVEFMDGTIIRITSEGYSDIIVDK